MLQSLPEENKHDRSDENHTISMEMIGKCQEIHVNKIVPQICFDVYVESRAPMFLCPMCHKDELSFGAELLHYLIESTPLVTTVGGGVCWHQRLDSHQRQHNARYDMLWNLLLMKTKNGIEQWVFVSNRRFDDDTMTVRNSRFMKTLSLCTMDKYLGCIIMTRWAHTGWYMGGSIHTQTQKIPPSNWNSERIASC